MNLLNTYKNKKVLIIGNTGFKGSWLTVVMLKMGAKVYGISNGVPSNPSFFAKAKLKNKIRYFNIDIRNNNKLNKKINLIKPDFIFHLAAQALVLESILNPVNTLETNINGTINVLNSIRDLKNDCSIVIITSDKCYLNDERKTPYTETDSLGGKDPYSASKAAAEIIFSCYSQTYFKDKKNIRISSARAGNVIGGGDWSSNRIIPDVVKSFSSNQKFVVRNPNSTRPWQHVLEPISGYIFLCHFLSNKKLGVNFESFNFAPNKFKNVSVKQIINKIKNNWPDIRPEFKREKKKSLESKLLQLNPGKSKKLLNWQSVLTLDETVSYTVDWYKSYFNNENIYSFSEYQVESYFKMANKKNKWNINI